MPNPPQPLRTSIPVEIRVPTLTEIENQKSKIENPDAPILDFIASDRTLDRYAEIIEPAGWRLDSYRRNPVFQNAHNYDNILFTLGKALITEVRSATPFPKSKIEIQKSEIPTNSQPSTRAPHESPPSAFENASHPSAPFLFQRIQFATEANPMARIAYGLYKGGFLRAVSVGFLPLRWQDTDGEEHCASSGTTLQPDAFPAIDQVQDNSPVNAVAASLRHSTTPPLHTPSFRRRFLEQELLEVSAVSIPANPNALILGYQAGAVQKSDLRELADLFTRTLMPPASATPPIPRHAVATIPPHLLLLARDLRSLLQRL